MSWKLTKTFSDGKEETKIFPNWEDAATVMQFDTMQEFLTAGQKCDWELYIFLPQEVGYKKNKESALGIHYIFDDAETLFFIEKEGN